VSVQTESERKVRRKRVISAAAILALLVAMFLGTKVVTGDDALAAKGFNAETWAEEKYSSEILPAILERSEDLVEVSEAIATDPAAAASEYGVVSGTSAPVYTVTFTGVAGELEGGIMTVAVDGLADDVLVRVQMGPAIDGTALRDASGLVHFPQFVNQIDYQDAGSALNNIVKETVLAGVDAASLSGKTVTITGPFQLINPQAYLITPVKIDVE
jgi:predicted lipoprotein